MIFTVNIYSEDDPPLTTIITVNLLGRFVDPTGIAVEVNEVGKRAQWTGHELVFDECFVVKFNPHASRIIYQLNAQDLPHTLVQALDLVSDAGPEVVVSKCELCGQVASGELIFAHTLCVCQHCRERKRLVPPSSIQGPPF